MTEKKAFNFYRNYHDLMPMMNDAQLGAFVRAISSVMFFDAHIDSISFKDPILSLAWASVKYQMRSSVDGFASKNNTSYDALVPPYLPPTQAPFAPPLQQEKGQEKEKGQVVRASKARPSSSDEVTEYALSIDFKLDGQHFIDYQTTRGWKLKGGQLIKDWKACVRTWKKHNKEIDKSESNPWEQLKAMIGNCPPDQYPKFDDPLISKALYKVGTWMAFTKLTPTQQHFTYEANFKEAYNKLKRGEG